MRAPQLDKTCSGGGGDSYERGARMLVVSLRGVNFGFLVSLGVFCAKHQYFGHNGLVYGCTQRK